MIAPLLQSFFKAVRRAGRCLPYRERNGCYDGSDEPVEDTPYNRSIMTLPSLADLRRDYKLASLSESDADADPFRQFQRWLEQAVTAQVVEPNAMTLATVNDDDQPSARVVLLKGLDDRGFVFYTNYASQKGNELAENPKAAVCFYWGDLERQVRVEGTTERVTREESADYFHVRPRKSQLAAWVSQQSSVISGRDELEQRMAFREQEFADKEVPLPPYWGGYRLIPSRIEFWQGRRSRLHDRLLYTRDESGWTRVRLAP